MMEPSKPLITPRYNGEYSTVRLPDGVIETIWFGNDGSEVTVGRSYIGIRETAELHIKAHEEKR